MLDGPAAAFAEYASVPDSWLAAKPDRLTFEQVAATPVAGVSAPQALRDKANIQKGQRVLVNGAAGAPARSPWSWSAYSAPTR